MNKVELVGRTTKDLEVRNTQSGTAVVRFTVAVNRRKKDDGADFISCVAFGKTAENMGKYVHKGDMVGVSGRIQTGSYEKDGQKVYTTDVIADEVEFLQTKGEKKEQDNDGFEPVHNGSPFDGELPF